MSERNDGGPAFPGFDAPPYGSYRGMTLRDYFASQSLSMLFAFYVTVEHDAIAADAYKLADAMLKAREPK